MGEGRENVLNVPTEPDPRHESAPRRRRTREQTEAELLAAARRLLERDGVLAGLNLREVATEAGVNHGQIYQYYGNRRALLRAAVAHALAARLSELPEHWKLGFTERRRRIFDGGLAQRQLARFEALLALDGDEQLTLLPELPRTRKALERDVAEGELPPDADPVVAHIMTAATTMGYRLFRDIYARDAGIDVEELDERAARVFDRMLEGLTRPGEGTPPAPQAVAQADATGGP